MGNVMQSIKPERSRGFLLIVVIGILAVLTVVCVGFLSYTRGEVDSVTSQRDKSDGVDVMHSAVDWTLANICKDVMVVDPGNPSIGPSVMAPNIITATPGLPGVSQCVAPGAAYRWWYRPNEMGLSAFVSSANWWNSPLPYMNANTTEAPWTYLPADFFPGGAVRGRFAVQVFDTNSVININDWNEDCNPSQAQMAHMLMDASDVTAMDNIGSWANGKQCRRGRDTGGNGGPWVPIRYQEAWRTVTHTARYENWSFYAGNSRSNVISYDWVTSNTSWFSLIGPDWCCQHSFMQSDGITQFRHPANPSPNYNGAFNFFPPDPGTGGMGGGGNDTWDPQHFTMSGVTTQTYVDPDTGRSPINVNTCYNSGEVWPNNWWDKVPTYTMEGVWNVESLRRLIKVGYFWTGTCFKDAQTQWIGNGSPSPAAGDALTVDEKMKVEQLKTKLAYQYQETLCRYFTGTYSHNNGRKWPVTSGAAIATFGATYPSVAQPSHPCTVTDYSAPRFNCSLTQFRQWVRDDLLTMATGATKSNPSFSPAPSPYPLPLGQFGPDRTDGTVSFDNSDRPEIAAGKLDMRVAAACYDNLCPGKPSDISMFGGCIPYKAGVAYPDPNYELYAMQLARQEDVDDKYNIDPRYVVGKGYDQGGGTFKPTPNSGAYPLLNNIYGYWADNCSLPEMVGYPVFPGYPGNQHMLCHNDHFGSAYNFGQANAVTTLPLNNPIVQENMGNAQNVCAKGRDICLKDAFKRPYAETDPMGPWIDNQIDPTSTDPNNNHVPWRQLSFSPDSFSTELTTTTTTFMLIINASLVDAGTVAANPTTPALHKQLWWNQWGMVVEIAPDVLAETDTKAYTSGAFLKDPAAAATPPYTSGHFPYALNPYPASGAANNAYPMYWQWYKNGMPQATKTDANGMDDLCPTLVTRNRDEKEGSNMIRTQNRWGLNYNTPINDPPGTTLGGGGIPSIDPEHSNATFITDWQADIRGVPPAGDPGLRGADVIYNSPGGGAIPNQIKKRVFVRSLWCLNQGIMQ